LEGHCSDNARIFLGSSAPAVEPWTSAVSFEWKVKKVEFKPDKRRSACLAWHSLKCDAFVPCKSLKNDILIELGSFRKKVFAASS
jgi:hypothetical protein